MFSLAMALIGVASQIARHGYGEPIVDLALRRKGVNRNAARLIAASVVSCHTTLVRVQAQALAQSQREQAYKQAARLAEIRAARAASYALRKLAAFALFVLIGLGGGAYLLITVCSVFIGKKIETPGYNRIRAVEGVAKPVAPQQPVSAAITAHGSSIGAGGMVAPGTLDRKSTRLNSSHVKRSRMPSSA